MRIEWDAEADALYICVRDGNVARTAELGTNCHVDVSMSGELIGIEVLSPGAPWPLAEIITTYGLGEDEAHMLMSAYPCSYSVSVEKTAATG
jgi:uncharacterized protein YuzE